ncbi:hypothetical protein DRT82_01015 [Salmonella enterica subsp. diarizonae]|nr:hypothetical protein [Salmonella enterica subsp. diarizonae]ECI3368050.1 hypothetical protein [Salmonella enterica subsp. diarizonae]ECI4841618.1 hypothetical protein [Salmonella enterica subsp. diarizonae]
MFNITHTYRLLVVKSFFVMAGLALIWNNRKASHLPVRLYNWLLIHEHKQKKIRYPYQTIPLFFDGS